MPSVGFEHTISAGERPQTYALDRTATGTCKLSIPFPVFTIAMAVKECAKIIEECLNALLFLAPVFN